MPVFEVDVEGVSVPPPFAIRPLPSVATRLLTSHHAPPRLVAHLALVHDASCELVERFTTLWPSLRFDVESVRVGAALHDVGKLVCREELRQAGTRHEAIGERWLVAKGFPPALARFARTHGRPCVDPDLRLEDWLVALADAVWKGKRPREIEECILSEIVAQTHKERWQVFSDLDTLITEIAEGAETRLRWHAANEA